MHSDCIRAQGKNKTTTKKKKAFDRFSPCLPPPLPPFLHQTEAAESVPMKGILLTSYLRQSSSLFNLSAILLSLVHFPRISEGGTENNIILWCFWIYSIIFFLTPEATNPHRCWQMSLSVQALWRRVSVALHSSFSCPLRLVIPHLTSAHSHANWSIHVFFHDGFRL